MSGILVLSIVGFAAACSSISTSSDYDQTYDFSTLKNYAWAEVAGDKQQTDQITLRRIIQNTDQVLAGKGFVKSDPKDASFLVAIQTGVQQETQYTTYGYGVGAWRGGGMATTTAQNYDEGTLILDVVDAKKKELVWRGSANGTLDPGASADQKASNVTEAVTKILADFPPTPGS
jgi:hypothetical protein